MTTHERAKLRTALSILSGRVKPEQLDGDELRLLGYDPYKFSALGRPSADDIREEAEDAVFNALDDLWNRVRPGDA